MTDTTNLSLTISRESLSSPLGSPSLQLPGVWKRGDSPLTSLPIDNSGSARTTQAESSSLGCSPFGLESPVPAGVSRVSQADFEVVSLIGYGHEGTVVQLVKSRHSGLLFAMKTIDKWSLIEKRNSGDSKAIGRATAERDLHVSLSSLHDCPYFVKFYYSFQTSRNLFYILEYCAWDVLDYVNHFGSLSTELMVLFLAEMTVALEFLHQNGSIHRDIKLDNILISDSGHVRLSDFGSSKTCFDRCDSIIGFSVAIMPPEFFAENPSYGTAIDWYQLGICAFEALTGTSPFGGQPVKDPKESTAWPPIYPRTVDPALEAWINALLHPGESLRLSGRPATSEVDWEKVRLGESSPVFNRASDSRRLWAPQEETGEETEFDPLPFQSFSYVRQPSADTQYIKPNTTT